MLAKMLLLAVCMLAVSSATQPTNFIIFFADDM
jgi:hypothetical protein